MTTIITRVGKGTTLSFHEVDQNFTNLNDDKLENDGGAFVNGTIDNTVIGGTTPAAATFKETVIKASGSTVPLKITNEGTGDSFLVEDSNPDSSPFVITSTGAVAIGATSVTSGVKLDVTGEVKISNFLHFGSNDNLLYQSAADSVALRIGTNPAYLGFKDSSGSPMVNGSGGVLLLGTLGTERVKLDSTGNVGIGVSPSGTFKLEVNGALNAGNTQLGTANTDSDSRLVVNGPVTIANSAAQTYKWQMEIDSSTSYFSFNRYYSSGVWNLYDSGLASSYFISSNTNGNSYFAWATANSNTANPTESMKLDSGGKLTLTGGSGGTQLEMRNGGDLVIYNSDNTLSSSLYCDVNKILYNDQRLVQSALYYRLNSGFAGSNATGAQSMFGVGATVAANTIYEFEIIFAALKTAGATSHTIAIQFGGTATLNNILYRGEGIVDNATPPVARINTTHTSFISNSVNALTLTAAIASATAYINYRITGTVSIANGGTFIPQYALSAAPGGAYTTQIGSYVKLTPIGASGANINVGSWA